MPQTDVTERLRQKTAQAKVAAGQGARDAGNTEALWCAFGTIAPIPGLLTYLLARTLDRPQRVSLLKGSVAGLVVCVILAAGLFFFGSATVSGVAGAFSEAYREAGNVEVVERGVAPEDIDYIISTNEDGTHTLGPAGEGAVPGEPMSAEDVIESRKDGGGYGYGEPGEAASADEVASDEDGSGGIE